MTTHTTKTFTDIEGVFGGATGCGIKPGRDDLSYIFVPKAHSAAGVFTKNSTAAPCVKFSRSLLRKAGVCGVIINAGCANAATGVQGYQNARATASQAARLFGVRRDQIVVASTGVIGTQLPMRKIKTGLHTMLSGPLARSGRKVARAIMTTDTFAKEIWIQGRVGKQRVTISGIAKGAGMIAPNMATMLGFLVTDAKVSRGFLNRALREAVDESFNMTSVDTDTSTNDMVLIFSTGAVAVDENSRAVQRSFIALLKRACQQLAMQIARDGEGATKLIEVSIAGARNRSQARKIALNIVNSPLVKTAIAGADPNWGRVVAAAGKDPSLEVNLEKLDISMGGLKVLKSGKIQAFQRGNLRKRLQRDRVNISVDLKLGKAGATAWGCDLTSGYVEINTQYS